MSTTVSELLVSIGVEVENAEKAERKIKGLEKETKDLATKGKQSTTRFARAFDRMGKRVGVDVAKMRAKIKAAGPTLKKFAKGFTVVATAVIGAGTAVGAFINKTTGAIDSLNKLAASTGVSIEELQRLDFWASQNGASTEDVSRAVRRLNQNLIDIGTGGGKAAADALATFGLTAEDLQGMSIEQQLGLIGDRFGQVANEAEAVTAASRIFGEEAGPRLATALKGGSEGIAELGAQARVLTQSQADEASAFQDLLGEVKGEIVGAARVIAVDMVPVVRDLVEEFRDWIKENEELIRENLPKILESIAMWLKQAGDAASLFLKAFGLVFDAVKAFDAFMTEQGGETWTGFRDTLLSLSNPLKVVQRGLQVILDLIVKLGETFPALQGVVDTLAGIGLVDKPTKGFSPKALGKSFGESTLGQGIAAIREDGLFGAAANARDRAIAEQARQESEKRGQRYDYLIGRYNQNQLSASEAQELTEKFNVPESVAKRGVKKPKRTGGGGRGGKAASEPEVVSGVTVDDAIAALLSGEADALNQTVQGLAQQTPSTKKIKPTVAIDFFSFTVTQNITSPNSTDAANQSVEMMKSTFRKATAKAGRSLTTNLVR